MKNISKRMKNSSLHLIALTLTIFLNSTPIMATPASLEGREKSYEGIKQQFNQADFEAWKQNFIKTKLKGVKSQVALDAVRKAEYDVQVIFNDRNQPERKVTFAHYYKHCFTDRVLRLSRKYMRDYQKDLKQIEKEYGIEPEIIVALLAHESKFGKIQGTYDLINSLTTLVYDGRRAELFEKELISVITMLEKEKLRKVPLKGSWAGGMGQCQFLPSIFLQHAVDHDGDGIKDIWESKIDAFASTANYLKSIGWEKGKYKVMAISLRKAGKAYYAAMDVSKPIKIDEESAVKYIKNYEKIKKDIKFPLYLTYTSQDGIIDQVYLIEQNFFTLKTWNRSNYFALGVMIFAEEVKMFRKNRRGAS
jgi:membrane-bound lytic murein transglycosylase B